MSIKTVILLLFPMIILYTGELYMNEIPSPNMRCVSSGFLLNHSLTCKSQHGNSSERTKRHVDEYELDYEPYDYEEDYLYHQYKSSSYYSYEENQRLNAFKVQRKHFDTYEELFRQFKPTPHDPTRLRAFGTRRKRATAKPTRRRTTTENPFVIFE